MAHSASVKAVTTIILGDGSWPLQYCARCREAATRIA